MRLRLVQNGGELGPLRHSSEAQRMEPWMDDMTQILERTDTKLAESSARPSFYKRTADPYSHYTVHSLAISPVDGVPLLVANQPQTLAVCAAYLLHNATHLHGTRSNVCRVLENAVLASQPLWPVLRTCAKHTRGSYTGSDSQRFPYLCADRAYT